MRASRALAPVVCIALLSACSLNSPPAEPTPTVTGLPTITPTPTPVLAAMVNGAPITEAEFDREVLRFEKAQAALGKPLDSLGDYRRQVLQSMIEETVAEQAAALSGRTVTGEQLDAVIQSTRKARGGEEAFQTWLADTGYTQDEFRAAVSRQLLVQSAMDAVTAQVPLAAEQVHARHILVNNRALADTLLSWLAGGTDFADTAKSYSLDIGTRLTGGDLGWFPRGVLTTPEVEDAAFSLQDGQLSQIVKSAAGYHIVQTLARMDSRPLSPESLETLRRKAVETWLSEQVGKADIRVFLP
jgi:peptidyl-prolyl cis-trans isomerase C